MKIFLVLSILTLAVSAKADQIWNKSLNLAKATAQKSSGRIIHAYKTKDFLKVVNVCSATLIAQDQILTAAHCFKHDELLKSEEQEKVKLRKSEVTTKIYFDIDGVTSKSLGDKIYKLADMVGFIRGENIAAVEEILKELPEIQNQKLHPIYEANPYLDVNTYGRESSYNFIDELEGRIFKSEAELRSTPKSTIYDLATASLTKKINSPPLKTIEYIPGEEIFTAGIAGGDLTAEQTVTKCTTGQRVLQYVISESQKLMSLMEIQINNFKAADKSKIPEWEYTLREMELDKKLVQHSMKNAIATNNEGILSQCHDSILQGYSGGPQFVVRNNEVYIAGITSLTVKIKNTQGKYVSGARASLLNLKN